MRKPVAKTTIGVILLMHMFIGIVFILKIPDFLTGMQTINYMCVLFSYYFVGMLWLYYIKKYGFYIFEHANMVMVITFISFSIEPMVSMIQNDMGIGYFYVFEGCIKATIIYVIAMFFFLYAYYKKSNYKCLYQQEDFHSDIVIKDKIVRWAFVIWCVGFFVQVIDLISNGYSIGYIFSIGTRGTMSSTEDGGLGIFGNIRYFMITALLYLYVYSDNKKIVWILRILSIMLSALRGYRWIIVVYLLSPLVVNSYISRKSPKRKNVIIIALALILMVGGLQFVRVSLKAGQGFSNHSDAEFNFAYIWGAFQGNFDLYKTLYGAVVYFPKQHFYTLGQQMVYLALVTIIPRAVWSNKPYSVIETIYKPYFMGNDAVRGAWAYAQLTEFYIEFGIIGVVVCMYIFGKLCRLLYRTAFNNNRTIHGVVLSATMFPMLMQFIIRGYMPLNLWPTVIILLPVIFMKLFVSNKKLD